MLPAAGFFLSLIAAAAVFLSITACSKKEQTKSSSTGNAQGVLYNKQVFKQAGITKLPKTTGIKTHQKQTNAIPLYINYAAGWTMGAWDAYLGCSATGDADYMNNIAFVSDNPAATGESDLFNTLNSKSELNINAGGNLKVQQIIENAANGTKNFDVIMEEWNTAWSKAQTSEGVEIKY